MKINRFNRLQTDWEAEEIEFFAAGFQKQWTNEKRAVTGRVKVGCGSSVHLWFSRNQTLIFGVIYVFFVPNAPKKLLNGYFAVS